MCNLEKGTFSFNAIENTGLEWDVIYYYEG